jgi:predicted TIM-barrel fold metal-dependent hydrolase
MICTGPQMLRNVATIFFAGAVMAGAALADDASMGPVIGAAIRDVPIFDAHMHCKKPAWDAYPVGSVIELMDKNGVAMAAVSSTPDEGTIKLRDYAPNRITPLLRPYHDSSGSSNWTKAAGMIDYIRTRIEAYSHNGIGEFHIHNLDPSDRPLLAAIAQIALQRDILLQIHTTAAPVRWLYEIEPRLTILWAHAGMSEPPQIVGAMLDEFPNLYADTSYRERDILSGDTIDPAWRDVFNRHPKRLMVGSDTWVNGQWDQYSELMALNRRWLAKLPRGLAENIAYRNAANLFGRNVSNALLGTR